MQEQHGLAAEEEEEEDEELGAEIREVVWDIAIKKRTESQIEIRSLE